MRKDVDKEVYNTSSIKLSKTGEYSGYSKPIYDEWVRTSQYVKMRDDTKLAVDIYRPAESGKPVSEPLPVIWIDTAYHRAVIQNGKLIAALDRDRFPGANIQMLKTLLMHGYVISFVQHRGICASFGTQHGPFDHRSRLDAYDVTEWFAMQPWCNGNVGMYGCSYQGASQYRAITEASPHLKAIFAECCDFDQYGSFYEGGVLRTFIWQWSQGCKWRFFSKEAAPVDEDSDGSMLREAIKEHEGNSTWYDLFSEMPCRDDWDNKTNSKYHISQSPISFIEEIEKSNVAIYHRGAWYDWFTRQTFLAYKNLNTPRKILVGPWGHCEAIPPMDRPIIIAEHLRWYDYWLKGIDNRIMDDPPIYYYTMGAPKGEEWRSAWEWPLPNTKSKDYYFHIGPSGTINSVNDGSLSTSPPTNALGSDDYKVDYTHGHHGRWPRGLPDHLEPIVGPRKIPIRRYIPRSVQRLQQITRLAPRPQDMTKEDRKGLTYTTSPLTSDLEVTGHPIVHLYVSSTATDGDFFVYLEDVDTNLVSNFVTDGVLRASHRAISQPPYDFMGLPWHRSFKKDLKNLSNKPTELAFDLHPTSIIFKAGHRIRIIVTCSEKPAAFTPELSPPPIVSVYHNANYPSHIILPIIPTDS